MSNQESGILNQSLFALSLTLIKVCLMNQKIIIAFIVIAVVAGIWGVYISGGPKQTLSLENEAVEIESYVPAPGEHYVNVVLPLEDKSIGATLTLSMEGQAPIVYTFPPDKTFKANAPLSYRFIVPEPLAPATLQVAYSDGEVRAMSQVIFDTMIRTP